MKKFLNKIQQVENQLLKCAETYGDSILRVSVGIVYVIFGTLKFFSSYSPAEKLAIRTIEELSHGLLAGNHALLSLALFETGLGLCLVFHYRLRLSVYLAAAHMLCTFLPLFFFPEEVFTQHPLSLSLLGQYIIKNSVFLGVLTVLYAKTVKRRHTIKNTTTTYKHPQVIYNENNDVDHAPHLGKQSISA